MVPAAILVIIGLVAAVFFYIDMFRRTRRNEGEIKVLRQSVQDLAGVMDRELPGHAFDEHLRRISTHRQKQHYGYK